MKNSKVALLLRILLTVIIVYSLESLLSSGDSYIGKDFFDSHGYHANKEEFVKQLEQYVLNQPDKEATIKAIEVTKDEIDFYRNYYGTETEQIYNVQNQYEEKIAEASNVTNPNQSYIESLQKERDGKILEIQKNFADDQVVKDKIVDLKVGIVNEYFARYENEKVSFNQEYEHFGYRFKNKTTGESVELNDDVKSIKKYDVIISPSKKHIYTTEYNHLPGLVESELKIVAPNDKYTGTVYLIDSQIESSGLSWDYKHFMMSKWLHYTLWALGIIALILLLTRYKWSNELFEPLQPYVEKTKKLPIDVLGAVLFFIISYATNIFDSSYLISRMLYNGEILITISTVISFAFSFLYRLIILSIIIFLGYSLVKRVQEQSKEELWETSFSARFIKVFKNLFLNRTIGVQTIFMFFVFYLGGFGLYVGLSEVDLFLFYSFLFVFILVPTAFAYLSRMGYLNKIMKQTELMANGQLTKPIKVKGNSPLAKHAQNLNALQEGVKTSVTAQAKSERLKTELITNVSHDLRTPLTSIITYTDLLKNPDLSNEEREKYVGILDKKAERLKILIEDLFEVSKMASGNIELVKQRVDIAQLLQQITGEHESDFAESNLDLRVTILAQPIFANVDGQKLWRVCDNLLNNARKYSLSGTRVYVDLREHQGRAIITVKNVSQYELEGDPTELMERFKRADLARHTEGSGLGLAIATSIVHLHGGTLEVTADGDLFKVTVELPC